jgi:hypothetical protein
MATVIMQKRDGITPGQYDALRDTVGWDRDVPAGETDQPWAPFTLQGVLGWLEPVYRRWLAQRPALLEDRRYVGPALTRVAVEHRGWERLTEEQVAQDSALPDGYRGGAYSEGWALIIGRFAVAAGAPPVLP